MKKAMMSKHRLPILFQKMYKFAPSQRDSIYIALTLSFAVLVFPWGGDAFGPACLVRGPLTLICIRNSDEQAWGWIGGLVLLPTLFYAVRGASGVRLIISGIGILIWIWIGILISISAAG
jgi:hypothetical protein